MITRSEIVWQRAVLDGFRGLIPQDVHGAGSWRPRPSLSPDLLTRHATSTRIDDMKRQALNVTDTDHVDIVASAQELLDALGAVAQIAHETRYLERLLDMEILSALGEGIKQHEVAAAAGKDPTTVRRWRDRAARFVMKLVTDAHFMDSSGESFLACECDQDFRLTRFSQTATWGLTGFDFVAAYSAIYRHWETRHGWNPNARDDAAHNAANHDLLSKRAIFEESAYDDTSHERVTLKGAIPKDAASSHVELLLNESPGLLPETISVLRELAVDADEQFSALGERIRNSQQQSETLGKIRKISEQLTEWEWALKVATALARGLNAQSRRKRTKSVTGATIAEAAGVSPATVTRWADEADELIRRISSGMLEAADEQAGHESLVCSLCEERFICDHELDQAAAIYRHWLMHHPTEEQPETPEQEARSTQPASPTPTAV